MWEVRVFVPLAPEDDATAVCRALCSGLKIPIQYSEQRTDLYLVGSDPSVGLKYRYGNIGGDLELKRTEEFTDEGAERISKTIVSPISVRSAIERCPRVEVKKHRWNGVGGREVTLLDVDSPVAHGRWISLCIEGIPKAQVGRAHEELFTCIKAAGVPTKGEVITCSYPKWLHRVVTPEAMTKHPS